MTELHDDKDKKIKELLSQLNEKSTRSSRILQRRIACCSWRRVGKDTRFNL